MLRAAAVVGRSFSLRALEAVTGQDADAVLDALDAAAGAALVGDAGDRPGRFVFRHALIHAAVADSVRPARRRLLHERVAAGIEASGPADVEDLAALAHHRLAAGDHHGGAEAAVRAGDAALAVLAPEEARDWYARALEAEAVTGDPPPARRADLLVRLGEAERRAGDEAFREHLLEAGRLAAGLGDAARLARAALANNRGMYSAWGALDEDRVAQLEDALRLVGEDDVGTRARLLATLSSELLWAEDPGRRRALSDEALAAAERADDPRILAEVVYRRCLAIAEPATLPERRELTGRLLGLADGLDDPLLRCLASAERGRVAVEAGDLDEALRHGERQRHLAPTCGDAYARHVAAWSAGWPLHLAGELDAAEAAAGEALQESLASGQPDAVSHWSTLVAMVRRDQGRLGELADAAAAAAADSRAVSAFRALAALALAEAGRQEEAAALVAAAATDRFALPRDAVWLTAVTLWGDACASTGQADAAALLLEDLRPWAGQVTFPGHVVVGLPALTAGRLAALLGHGTEADALLVRAEVLAARLRAPGLLARVREARGGAGSGPAGQEATLSPGRIRSHGRGASQPSG